MRRCLLALAVLLHASPALAQLQKVEAGDMRLVYISPSETFLVPHAGRTFMSSVTFLKTLFDYQPREKITVLLTDFSDAGNAGATSVPHDTLRVQIAPLSFAFETIMANERMNTIMNHETVHVIAMDQAAGRDLFFRGLFGGKVLPIAEQPETMLYFYLTIAARRGAALVSRRRRGVRRHLDGGRHRPRAGRLRRDGVPRDGQGRRALLRSARPRVRRHEDRLSDRGQLVPLRHAVHHVARRTATRRSRSSSGWAGSPGAGRTTRASSSSCSARRSRRRGRNGSSSSTTFQQANLDGDPQVPGHAVHGSVAARARLGLARVLRFRVAHDLRGVQLPRGRRARGRDLDGHRGVRRI